MNTKISGFRLTDKDREKLLKLADRSGLAQSEVVRVLIHRADSLPKMAEADLVGLAIRRPVGRPKSAALGAS